MNAKRNKSKKKEKMNTSTSEEQPPTEATALEEEVEALEAEALEAEAESFKDQYQRLLADFDNFRKRTQRERQDLAARATEDLVVELLPLVDHFELGLRNARDHEANESIVEGFQLVHDQLLGALAKFGLKPIDAMDQPFNPHVHEAITHMPSEEHPADMVIAQTRRGYQLGQKLLRAAQVVVSSGPQEEDSRPEESPDDENEA